MANKVKFMSQKGTAQYPWLNRPDTAYHAEGQYKVNLKMSPSEGAELMKAAQQFANDNFGTKGDTAKMPWKIRLRQARSSLRPRVNTNPSSWTAKVRSSLRTKCPRFSVVVS